VTPQTHCNILRLTLHKSAQTEAYGAESSDLQYTQAPHVSHFIPERIAQMINSLTCAITFSTNS
jgi:hypothetical protein